MATSDANSVLQRKMDASRQTSSGGGRSAAGALRLAMARSADDLFDLAVSVIGALQARVSGDALAAHLSDDRMQVLLDGPGGQLGALSVDRVFLAALIQQQTMRKLTGAEPEERPFTATDAAMIAPLIDEVLKRAGELAEKANERACLEGFKFGARAEDARAVTLAMEADQFRVFDLTLEFADGPLQAAMTLLLPETDTVDEELSENIIPQNSTGLGKAVESAHAELTAVICRMKLPLAELSAMQPGEVLPLVQDDLEHTDLMTITGEKVSSGRLGQISGIRAVRLNETHPLVTTNIELSEFAPDIGAATPVLETQLAIESGDPDVSGESSSVEEPDGLAFTEASEAEAEDAILNMTPEEAAVEISALAGLPLEESEQDAPPVPVA